MIEAGQPAPTFTLRNQDDEPVSLDDYKGQKVVLYFYPKADTPGCTTQACGIRDRSGEYAEAGATVIGVSGDEPTKLRKFADKYDLDFTLVGDPDHDVLEAYGVWVEKKNYGKTYMGIQRATFIIGEDGKVAHVIPKASPKTHDDEVLGALAAL
ncbi:MAG TPA: thioredoxin-dependent thiol peroxidase [Thermoleophilaceae bacterium]|nr:thioredoxin-dependent thiol peroxidase [Thermoleophilaceae bacterium]